MITNERALQLMTKSFDQLKKTDLIKKDETLDRETILLGRDSPLDSIGFVTFITDLEERVSEETKKDFPLVLNEISGFNVNKPDLSAEVLAAYIAKRSQNN